MLVLYLISCLNFFSTLRSFIPTTPKSERTDRRGNKQPDYLPNLSLKETPCTFAPDVFGWKWERQNLAAGKSECTMPEEDKLEITTLSSNAFYYFGMKSLKHKLLLIEDLDRAEAVLYPLRELQSKRKISKKVTLKDNKYFLAIFDQCFLDVKFSKILYRLNWRLGVFIVGFYPIIISIIFGDQINKYIVDFKQSICVKILFHFLYLFGYRRIKYVFFRDIFIEIMAPIRS